MPCLIHLLHKFLNGDWRAEEWPVYHGDIPEGSITMPVEPKEDNENGQDEPEEENENEQDEPVEDEKADHHSEE